MLLPALRAPLGHLRQVIVRASPGRTLAWQALASILVLEGHTKRIHALDRELTKVTV